jgi:N-acetylmuramoyl-L-alanine amidase
MGKLIITAGHHAKDSGAVGNGYKENTLNVEIVDLIIQRLKQLDPSIEIWTDDFKLTLSQVIAKVKEFATIEDVWVEYHFDSSITPKVSGATALVADGARQPSKDLGKKLVDIGSTILEIPNRGVKSEKDSARGRLAMLHTKATSVLYEVGFISNPTDMINHQDWKHWLADEHARILIKTIGG